MSESRASLNPLVKNHFLYYFMAITGGGILFSSQLMDVASFTSDRDLKATKGQLFSVGQLTGKWRCLKTSPPKPSKTSTLHTWISVVLEHLGPIKRGLIMTDPFLQNIGNFGWFSGFLRFIIFQFSKHFVVSHIFEKSPKSFLMSYSRSFY